METFKRRKCFSSDKDILAYAIELAKEEMRVERFTEGFTEPDMVKNYLQMEFVNNDHERESFVVLVLDGQHHLIDSKVLFHGTVNASPVYAREVVKLVLRLNGSSVIFAHNHPGGSEEPSQADIRVTERLKKALELIDVATLDHFVIAGPDKPIVSLAERGLL